MKKTISSTALALVAVLALAGCGSGNDAEENAATEFNSADVTFAQSMIPHHEQAVVMAKMAKTQGSSAQVKMLAEQIEAEQAPEIGTMKGWLKSWGKGGSDSSGHGMDGMDGGDMMNDADMPGMMSGDDMSELGKSSGPAFDQMFLTMMIRHHEGAIEMAATEQQDGKSGEAVRLAEQIEDAQTSEIALMKSLLAS